MLFEEHAPAQSSATGKGLGPRRRRLRLFPSRPNCDFLATDQEAEGSIPSGRAIVSDCLEKEDLFLYVTQEPQESLRGNLLGITWAATHVARWRQFRTAERLDAARCKCLIVLRWSGRTDEVNASTCVEIRHFGGRNTQPAG